MPGPTIPGPFVGGWPGGCPGWGPTCFWPPGCCWARAGEVSSIAATSTEARIVNRFMMSPPLDALIVPLLRRLITLTGGEPAADNALHVSRDGRRRVHRLPRGGAPPSGRPPRPGVRQLLLGQPGEPRLCDGQLPAGDHRGRSEERRVGK